MPMSFLTLRSRHLGACLGLAAAAWLALAPGAAGAQTVLADFQSAPPNGVYALPSWTPRALPELIRGRPADAEPVNLVAHLFLPEAAPAGSGDARVPAVLLVHGSGGIYSAMLDHWPKLLNSAGYAVLSLDMFGPRGVRSTAEDQSQVPLASDLADAYVALKALASHPRIDAQRIAVMGFSRGGLATWRAALKRVAASQALPAGLRFAAHIPVYSGGCVGPTRVLVKPGVFGPAPMLWLHGDADDYAAMPPCQAFAQEIGAAGTPVEFVVIPGARHKFDADDQRRITVRGAQRTVEDCPLAMDIDTYGYVDRRSGQRLQGEALASTQKACQAIGATVEGNRAAREQASQAVLAFLRKVFGR